jgi:hypothetical protein
MASEAEVERAEAVASQRVGPALKNNRVGLVLRHYLKDRIKGEGQVMTGVGW